MNAQLTIGEAAKKVGLSTKTIRYYESIALLQKPNRKENGYRLYSDNDIQLLTLIKQTKSMGIPLAEIKRIITVCNNEGCDHVKNYLKLHISEYVATIDQKITELQALKTQLNSLDISLAKPQKNICDSNCYDLPEIMKGGE